MTKIFNTGLLALMCFISAIALVTSCKKDNNVNSGKVELLSFGPTGAKHGDTLRFIGNNLNLVTEIAFTGNSAVVAQSAFVQQSNELILVVVPQAAEQGYVTLRSPQGDLVTKTQLNLNVMASVTALTANARPGENITITGQYLNWVTSVVFAKDKMVDSFVSKAFDKIVVTVPHDAQSGTIVLNYSGTKPLKVESADTLHVALPLITSLAPNPVKHAANLTINGTNLDLVTKVMFTGVANAITSFVSQSATQLVVKIPASTSKGKITLEAPSGVQTVSSMDLNVVLPSITSITPNPVDIGSNLTITGTDLDIVSNVTFVGASNSVSTFVSQSATKLVVKVPEGSVTAKITLAVANSTLSVKSNDDLKINGSSVPPIIIYDDAITSAWNGWIGGGWGGSKDLNNTSPVKTGSKSIAISYTSGGYGVPLQLGGANISLAGYTDLRFSVYGGAGSDGKTVNVGINEVDGKTITIKAGQWTDFSIPLSQMTSASTMSFLYLKNYSSSGDFTIYVDNIGIY